MNDSPVAERLATWAHHVYRAGIPEEVEERAAVATLDTVGCVLAGISSEPVSAVTAMLSEECPEWRLGTLSADRLGLLLGTAAHAHDFDDAQLPTLVHPSVVAVPTALANLGRRPVSGTELMRAIAIGAEISVRAGSAALNREARDSVLFERGLHMTSLCGTLGAAVIVGLLRGLEPQRLAHALSISTSFASGLLEGNRAGGSIKPVHAGWAAAAGAIAASLAAQGLTGAPAAIEGRFGYLRAYMGEQHDRAALTRGLGTSWQYLSTLVKPFPTNGFTHPAVEIATTLHGEGISPEQVRTIDLDLPGPTLRTVAEPAASKAKPTSGYAARFSAPFTVAVGLRGGGGLGVALDDFTDSVVGDPELLSLAGRVRCRAGERESALFPDHLACTARITLDDGSVRTLSVDDSLGSPARPLSTEQVRGKFRANASRLAPAAVDQLEAILLGVGGLSDAATLTPGLFRAFQGHAVS